MFTICFDTICAGYQPVSCGDDYIKFATEEEAQAEIDGDEEFYNDCFVCPVEDIGHKTIFTGGK